MARRSIRHFGIRLAAALGKLLSNDVDRRKQSCLRGGTGSQRAEMPREFVCLAERTYAGSAAKNVAA